MVVKVILLQNKYMVFSILLEQCFTFAGATFNFTTLRKKYSASEMYKLATIHCTTKKRKIIKLIG